VDGSLDVDEVGDEGDAHPGLLVFLSQPSSLALVNLNVLNSRTSCTLGSAFLPQSCRWLPTRPRSMKHSASPHLSAVILADTAILLQAQSRLDIDMALAVVWFTGARNSCTRITPQRALPWTVSLTNLTCPTLHPVMGTDSSLSSCRADNYTLPVGYNYRSAADQFDPPTVCYAPT
jgi:hypothetical protein